MTELLLSVSLTEVKLKIKKCVFLCTTAITLHLMAVGINAGTSTAELQTDGNSGWDADPGDNTELCGLWGPSGSAKTHLTDQRKFWACTVGGVILMHCYIKLTQPRGNIGYNPSKTLIWVLLLMCRIKSFALPSFLSDARSIMWVPKSSMGTFQPYIDFEEWYKIHMGPFKK